MRTEAEAMRDAIASGTVVAWHLDKEIQFRGQDGAFSTWRLSKDAAPIFSDPELFWRPAPTKRRIPFTQLTIPKGALWNLRNMKWETALEFRSCDVRFSGGDLMSYDRIAETADYSTDGGATWQPGSLEVES